MIRRTLPLAGISDFDSFHCVSADSLGFPEYYGKNMNAWIDVMTDWPQTLSVAADQDLVLVLSGSDGFAKRCPDVLVALWEAVASVNGRRSAGSPRLLLDLA